MVGTPPFTPLPEPLPAEAGLDRPRDQALARVCVLRVNLDFWALYHCRHARPPQR